MQSRIPHHPTWQAQDLVLEELLAECMDCMHAAMCHVYFRMFTLLGGSARIDALLSGRISSDLPPGRKLSPHLVCSYLRPPA